LSDYEKATGVLYRPWSDEEVELLNKYQILGKFHPYTCGGNRCRNILLATRDGWVCTKCDYTQNWAHAMTLDVVRPYA